jgi:hypothetical protein
LDLIAVYSLFDVNFSYHVLRAYLMKRYAVKDKGEHIMMFVYENPNWITTTMVF